MGKYIGKKRKRDRENLEKIWETIRGKVRGNHGGKKKGMLGQNSG